MSDRDYQIKLDEILQIPIEMELLVNDSEIFIMNEVIFELLAKNPDNESGIDMEGTDRYWTRM